MNMTGREGTIDKTERFRDEYGRHCILVRIKIGFFRRACEWSVGKRTIFPSGNCSGMMLLARVLELALESQGLNYLPVDKFVGTLNDCDILLPAKEIYPTFEVARAEINRLHLSECAQFGFYDFSTRSWRQLWPEPDGPFEPLRTKLR